MHGPPTYQVAWRILGHAQDCEDVLQDVFIEAHQLYLGGKVTHWRTFLNRLVTFRALDSVRRRKDVRALGELHIRDTAPGPDDVAIRRDDEAHLRSVVAALPPRQAAVFCLAHFEGLSHQEISGTLDISTNAVAMALHKARVSLRATLLEEHKEQM